MPYRSGSNPAMATSAPVEERTTRLTHGDIRVVSSPGDTRFQVRLPITPGSPPGAASQ